jgi:hypothetical protein
MSTTPSVKSPQPSPAPGVPVQAVPAQLEHTDGVTRAMSALEEAIDKRLDQIEMIGEEAAAGMPLPQTEKEAISPGMRYLHVSRTIYQLINDRNRAVGLYLAVASLLLTASSALLNAKPTGLLIVPIEDLQRWCLPVTFGILTVLSLFTDFLLIRTRTGLIYEVAKMNTLLGLPIGRVKRIGPLSLFFIMHLLTALAGGGSAALFAYHLLVYFQALPGFEMLASIGIGVLITMFLVALYIGTVNYVTSEKRLGSIKG